MRMASKVDRPHRVWMEGLLTLFESPFPGDASDQRLPGFNLGQQIVGLYLAELLLKHALDDAGKRDERGHNLHQLFLDLPASKQQLVEQEYKEFLNSKYERAPDYAKSADSLLRYLGDGPITDTRYFWERLRPNSLGSDRCDSTDKASIAIQPGMLDPLIYALRVALHRYPKKTFQEKYDTKFLSPKELLKEPILFVHKGFISRGPGLGPPTSP